MEDAALMPAASARMAVSNVHVMKASWAMAKIVPVSQCYLTLPYMNGQTDKQITKKAPVPLSVSQIDAFVQSIIQSIKTTYSK